MRTIKFSNDESFPRTHVTARRDVKCQDLYEGYCPQRMSYGVDTDLPVARLVPT